LSKTLLPAISELTTHKSWRVKVQVFREFPSLAKQLGEIFFNKELLPTMLGGLSDPVYAIREAAMQSCAEIAVWFGERWAPTHVLPKLISYQNEQNYLY
jgi:serine/threonine-protein phosphatase 2A regulatory subunit A